MVGLAVSGVLVAVGVRASSVGGEQCQTLVPRCGPFAPEEFEFHFLVAQCEEPVVVLGHRQCFRDGDADTAVGLTAAGQGGELIEVHPHDDRRRCSGLCGVGGQAQL